MIFRKMLFLALTPIFMSQMASAHLCKSFLSFESNHDYDHLQNFAHNHDQDHEEHITLKAWKQYTLTDPELEVSAKAYEKLKSHYFQIFEEKLNDRLESIGLHKAEDLRTLAYKKIEHELKKLAQQIYFRFEESKKSILSNPEFYRSEVAAIKEQLFTLEHEFDVLMETILDSNG